MPRETFTTSHTTDDGDFVCNKDEEECGKDNSENIVEDELRKNYSNFSHNSKINTKDIPRIDPVAQIFANIKRIDHETVNSVILTTLSPELAANEQQKRVLKEDLMKYIKRAIWIQCFAIGIATLIIIFSICLKCSEDVLGDNIGTLFGFLQFYITATITELIAMLFFIVRFVFDKSIVELLDSTIGKKKYKKKINKENDEEHIKDHSKKED